jgi:hypothetical protein
MNVSGDQPDTRPAVLFRIRTVVAPSKSIFAGKSAT